MLEVLQGGALFECISFCVFVLFEDALNFRFQKVLIFELKVFEKNPLPCGRYEVLSKESSSEFSLIIA